MSILPVDLQVMVQRGSEMTRLVNADNHRAEVDVQQFNQIMVKQSEVKEQQVAETDKTVKQQINKDGKNKGDASSKKRNQNDKKEKEAEKPKELKSSSMFDVKI